MHAVRRSLFSFFLLAAVAFPAPSAAQNIQISLDSAALDGILSAEYGRSFPINSVFSLENLRIARITLYAVTASFHLVFAGEVEVRIPFTRVQRIRVHQRVPLEASFVPRFSGHKLEIPVREITLSFQDTVQMNMGNPLVAAFEAFRRFLGSDSAVAWMQKKLTLNLDKKLSSWFGSRKFTGTVQLGRNRLQISLAPAPENP